MENWKEQRDENTVELKSISDPQSRRERLEEIQNTASYRVSKFIKRIKSEFPGVYENARVNYGADYSSIESSKDWDTKDISDKIPKALNLYLELQMLNGLLTKEHHDNSTLLKEFEIDEELEKLLDEAHLSTPPQIVQEDNTVKYEYEKYPIQIFVNELSEGEYFDKRNLNHILSGAKHDKDKLGIQLDIGSRIQFARGTRVMWFERGANPWLSGYPLLIMTPYSEKGREFIRRTVLMENGEYNFWAKDSKYFLANLPLENEDKNNGVHLVFDSPESGVSWSDVFDIIVDLRLGKVFKRKHTDSDNKEIDKDIKHFREVFSLKEE